LGEREREREREKVCMCRYILKLDIKLCKRWNGFKIMVSEAPLGQ
jgi:hypothetical protein